MARPLSAGVPADAAPGSARRLVVGIGELAVSDCPDVVIVTHALGSCIAVCVFDPVVRVGGMLHFMLPEASINEERARQRPAAFADTGIPLLFARAAEYGLLKKRAIVKLVGGAEIVAAGQRSTFAAGRRNTLAARQVLWRCGVLVSAEDTGRDFARTVQMAVHDGRLRVFSGNNQVTEI